MDVLMNTVLIVFVMISLRNFGECKGTREDNLLVDQVLTEGNKNIQLFAPLPFVQRDEEYKAMGSKLKIQSVGAIVKRSQKVSRAADVRSGYTTKTFHFFQFPAYSGNIEVELDNISVSFGLISVHGGAKLTLSESFLMEMIVDKTSNCSFCSTSIYAFKLQAPRLAEFDVGYGPSALLLRFLSWMTSNFQLYNDILLDFFSGPLYLTTFVPLREALILAVCNCSKT